MLYKLKALLLRWIGHNAFQFQCDCGAGVIFFVPWAIFRESGSPYTRGQMFSIKGQNNSDTVGCQCESCGLIYTLTWKGTHFTVDKREENGSIPPSQMSARDFLLSRQQAGTTRCSQSG